MKVHVAGIRETPETKIVIDVTSRSSISWARGLSPFHLGPIPLYDGMVSKNMENAWQYSKVYKPFINAEGEISPEYQTWAKNGWNRERADRYPMGKGAIPEFSLWKGKRLEYIEAREQIYLPLYARSVVGTEAFRLLRETAMEHPVTLVDFDVHKSGTENLYATLKDPSKKFGHGFVLFGLLTGKISPEGKFIKQDKSVTHKTVLPSF